MRSAKRQRTATDTVAVDIAAALVAATDTLAATNATNVAADAATICRRELTQALRQEIAPKVNIIRRRSHWSTAVANFSRFTDSIATEVASSRIESDEAALWKISWCANAAALMMGANLPTDGDNTHLKVLHAAERLAMATKRLTGVSKSTTELNYVLALIDVIVPALELYETCCFLRSKVALKMLLCSALQQSTQGGPADCLLMVVPILLPNLCGALRYLSEALPKKIE